MSRNRVRVLRFLFSPDRAEQRLAATSEVLGRPIAILIDGEIVSAPALGGPFSESVIVDADLSCESAAELAASFKP